MVLWYNYIMKILVKDQYMHEYEAHVVEFKALQDFMFVVSYYDDEGVFTTETVDHKRLIIDEQLDWSEPLISSI